jgi:hypothetical protein
MSPTEEGGISQFHVSPHDPFEMLPWQPSQNKMHHLWSQAKLANISLAIKSTYFY